MNSSSEENSVVFSVHCKSGKLVCHELLRHLPGRRAVYKGDFNKQAVIIKCFTGKKAFRDYLRECRGLKGFVRAKIDTPKLLFSGKAVIDSLPDNAQKKRKSKVYVVVTRFLTDAVSFEQLWKTALSDSQRLVWLYRIIRLFGRLYKAGVTPVDIHLDNLLVCNQDVWLIDGGGVTVRSLALSRAKALDNFTLFMSVLAPRYEHFVHKLYLALASFAPKYAGISMEQLLDKIHQRRKWRERYLEKTLRSCSDFMANKGFTRFQVVDRLHDSPSLRKLLSSPDEMMASGELIKQGRTNTVVVVTLNNGRKVVVKRYQSTKRFSWLKMLKRSRARNSWLGAYLLKMLDIDTPQPLALLEKRFGPFVICSYFVSDYIPGVQLLHYFTQYEQFKNADEIVGQIKDCLFSLERSFISHGDLKATNFIIYNGRVYLIDLDSLLSCKTFKSFQPLWEKDCDRFMKNWQNAPDVVALFQSHN